MIHKSATLIGTIEFKNGNRNRLYLGHNQNTGEAIVWQKVNANRATRATGGNIVKLAAELNHLLNEGEARWIGDVNDACLNFLRANLQEV